jgi:hypothetical protein
MSELSTKLDGLADALADSRIDVAEELATEVAEEFEQLTRDQTELVRRSLLSRTQDTTDEERQVLEEHTLSSIALALTESAFLMNVLSAIEDPDGPEDELISEIRELADEFETQEQDAQSGNQSVEQIVGETEIPPAIEVTLETPRLLELTTDDVAEPVIRIKNVGDSTLTGIDLMIEADDGVSIDTEATAVGDLNASKETTKRIQVTGRESGDSVVRFDAVSENGGTDFTTLDVLVNTGTILADYTDRQDVVGLNGLRRAIDDWRDDRIKDELLNAVVDAWRLERKIEQKEVD